MAGSSSADRFAAQTALPMKQCIQRRATHPGPSCCAALSALGQLCVTLKPGAPNAREVFAAVAAVAEALALQAVYSVLKEAEHRSTFYIPYWNLPLAMQLVPRQRRFTKNLRVSIYLCIVPTALMCSANCGHADRGFPCQAPQPSPGRERWQGALLQSAWRSGCSSTDL